MIGEDRSMGLAWSGKLFVQRNDVLGARVMRRQERMADHARQG